MRTGSDETAEVEEVRSGQSGAWMRTVEWIDASDRWSDGWTESNSLARAATHV